MTAPAIRVLSLGAGVQSTTLALLAVEGAQPLPDAAILDAIADLEAGIDEDGDPDGCSPYGCRSGLPAAEPGEATA